MPLEVFRSFVSFEPWARKRAQALAMETNLCPLPELKPDWSISEDVLGRPDGRFFTVRGVQVTKAAGREVSGWGQPIICDDTGGYVALASVKFNGSDRGFLVRLKAEPGNCGIEIDGTNTRVLVAPTAQFSMSNLEQDFKARQGVLDSNGKSYKRVPFASVAAEREPAWVRASFWEDAPEDGGRFYQKVNHYGRINATSVDDVEEEVALTGQESDFCWVDLFVLRAIRSEGFANGHLRSVMSLLV